MATKKIPDTKKPAKRRAKPVAKKTNKNQHIKKGND